ncbi:MAG: type II toxin-antitoxin system RelE/ParE family toxin [Cytophagaceae bacterium]|nr:type II toxin-antitoxin system RelE/ParE family toxin [Cytophagaceae bacterium]
MKVEVAKNFRRETKRLVKKYRSLAQEVADLITNLPENPNQGTPIGRDCYKIRLAIASKGKGKSGGGRVITCVKVTAEIVTLLTIYDKSEQEDIADNALTQLLEDNDLL